LEKHSGLNYLDCLSSSLWLHSFYFWFWLTYHVCVLGLGDTNNKNCRMNANLGLIQVFSPLHFCLSGCILKVLYQLFDWSHLSKGSSGRKQKCTQFPTPSSSIVFHAFSHGVIYFVQSVSFKNLDMEFCDWHLKIFHQRESGFSS